MKNIPFFFFEAQAKLLETVWSLIMVPLPESQKMEEVTVS